MPTHSKAIREYAIQHAVSEMLGILGVTLYVGVLGAVVTRLAVVMGMIG